MIKFNSEHLDIVRDCAVRCAREVAWPNEMAVYDWVRVRVRTTHSSQFDPALLNMLRFCAQEVEHQKEGALPVFWYVDAWNQALCRREAGGQLDLKVLNELAARIEPEANIGGRYRTGRVTIGGVLTGTPPEYIERDMAAFEAELIAYQQGERADFYGRPLTAQSLYVRFEEIHPRANGNGREGKIIYNWLNDTLTKPQFPAEPGHFATHGTDR